MLRFSFISRHFCFSIIIFDDNYFYTNQSTPNNMKAKIIISAMSLFLFTYSSFAQNKKGFQWGLSIAMNSIQAQVEIPLITSIGGITFGPGVTIVDADGNIIARGDRVDNSFSYSIVPKYY